MLHPGGGKGEEGRRWEKKEEEEEEEQQTKQNTKSQKSDQRKVTKAAKEERIRERGKGQNMGCGGQRIEGVGVLTAKGAGRGNFIEAFREKDRIDVGSEGGVWGRGREVERARGREREVERSREVERERSREVERKREV